MDMDGYESDGTRSRVPYVRIASLSPTLSKIAVFFGFFFICSYKMFII
jgi:hypothetical protein